MPIDPNIPLQIQAPQSPFQAIQAPLQTAQGLLTLRQNQMQLGANQAISQAYSQAVNPDGSVDFNKLQSLAAQSGAGAYLPQFMGQLATQRNQQQQYEVSKLDMALKQQQAIRGMIGSLAVDPDMGKSDMSGKIVNQISNAVSSGLIPLDVAINQVKAIPSDPGAQAGWIQNHLINSLSGEAKIQALMPQNVVLNTGGQQVLLNRNPLTGQSQIAGTVNNTLSPGEMAQNVDVVDPSTGAHYAITKAQQLQMQGGVPTATQGYTGRYSAPGEQGTFAGGVQTALSPAQQAAQTAGASTQAAGSAQAAQELHNAAADAPMRLNLLENARDALTVGVDANGHPIDTGPGAAWRNEAKSFFNALAPDTAKAIGWTGDVQSFDEFKKILTNYASSVSGSLGTGTDARLNAAVTGNANPSISSLANQDILAKTIAAEKMRAAQDYAWQNSGNTPDKFNQWQSQWNKTVSPDAFVFTSMNPQQQQAFLKRQSPAQLATFKSNLANLVRAGIIEMPAQSQPAAPQQPLPPSGVPR